MRVSRPPACPPCQCATHQLVTLPTETSPALLSLLAQWQDKRRRDRESERRPEGLGGQEVGVISGKRREGWGGSFHSAVHASVQCLLPARRSRSATETKYVCISLQVEPRLSHARAHSLRRQGEGAKGDPSLCRPQSLSLESGVESLSLKSAADHRKVFPLTGS